MKAKTIYPTIILVLLALRAAALTDNVWTGAAGTDWLNSSNWSSGALPTEDETVNIATPQTHAEVIGYNQWASAGQVRVGYSSGNGGKLVIDNFAGLNVKTAGGAGDLYLGVDSAGYLYLRDGFVWCGNCYISSGSGWGHLEIYSGGLSCETLNVAGRVNLYGFAAYVETNNLVFSGPNKAIELKDGRIVWHGNHQAEVQAYIGQGLIYCLGGTVLYDYDISTAGATTIYATTKEIIDPFTWTNRHNETLSGKYIRSFSGYGIYLNNCTNITIEDCEFGPCRGNAIDTNGGNNITVRNCTFRHCQRAVWFWDGGANMKVLDCWILNSLVRDQTYSHGIAMCRCIGTGLEIRGNRIQNQGDALGRGDDPGDRKGFASVTDNINTYLSEGTVYSPLTIEHNWIKNWDQMEWGGCGITTGDSGGAFNLVRYNRIINAQYGGISIAGGTYANIQQNIIYSDRIWNDNGGCGIVVWDYVPTYNCNNHTVMNNDINFETSYGYKQCKWQHPDPSVSCGIINGWSSNNCYYAGMPDDILPGNIFYACTAPPAGDLSGDCITDQQDLNHFGAEWLGDDASPANFNADEIVNLDDFRLFVQEWLECGYFPPTPCP